MNIKYEILNIINKDIEIEWRWNPEGENFKNYNSIPYGVRLLKKIKDKIETVDESHFQLWQIYAWLLELLQQESKLYHKWDGTRRAFRATYGEERIKRVLSSIDSMFWRALADKPSSENLPDNVFKNNPKGEEE